MPDPNQNPLWPLRDLPCCRHPECLPFPQVSSLCRWNVFPALHYRARTRTKALVSGGFIFMYSKAGVQVCMQPWALVCAPIVCFRQVLALVDRSAATFKNSLGKCNEVKCHNNRRSAARLQFWQPASAHRSHACVRACVCVCVECLVFLGWHRWVRYWLWKPSARSRCAIVLTWNAQQAENCQDFSCLRGLKDVSCHCC